jgi:hypothetical protein
MLGVATGAYPTDAALRGITDMSKNHAMMFEAIQQMEKVWKAEPFQEQGQFWNVGFPQEDPEPFRDVRPWWGNDHGDDRFSAPSPSIPLPASMGSSPPRSMPATNSCAVTLPPTRKRWRPLARPTDR